MPFRSLARPGFKSGPSYVTREIETQDIVLYVKQGSGKPSGSYLEGKIKVAVLLLNILLC